MTALTPRQGEVFAFIKSYTAEYGYSPTFTEIAGRFDLASKSGVHRLLSGLEDRGVIRRVPNRARAIEVVENGAEFHLKRILDAIAATGFIASGDPIVTEAARHLRVPS